MTVSIAHPEETVRPELNVIGRTVEEATGEVEQYWTGVSSPDCHGYVLCTVWAWECCVKRCGR